MANSLTIEEGIVWEKSVEAFENVNMFAANAEVFKPGAAEAALSGQTHRIPYANQIGTSTGLDVTSSINDVADITVPISLALGDIKNSTFQLTVNESMAGDRVSRNIDASVRKLSSVINTACADLIVDRGTSCRGFTTDLSTYEHFASAEQLLSEIAANNTSERFLYLPPSVSSSLANELGMRATENARDHMAYGSGYHGNIAGFETFKSGVVKQVGVHNETTVTVNGADQDVDPVAWDSNTTQAAPATDDPRTQGLTVTNTSGDMTNGDVFTIAGVNAVDIDTKVDTGNLKTFRVISGGGTTSLTISPAIVVSGAYQNVTAKPANAAVLSAHNTVAQAPALWSTKDAISLYCADLDWNALNGSAETTLSTYTTSAGVQIAFIRQGSALTGVNTYRFSAWVNPNMVQPEKCGLILGNQTTAF